MPTYRKPVTKSLDPYKTQPLPTKKPIAVYYRQSSEGQVGNISTTMQTVDMVEHLVRQGWHQDSVLMIDSDAGVSGTKKIRERKGLSEVFDLILDQKIGVVAAQDVDRFFRDMAQIETNIFIDACRENNVLVLTPSFVYDFAHPSQGRYHIQMFREQVQRAADFLEYHIKGRLLPARHRQMKSGQWGGSVTLLGYMVDTRPELSNGNPNPDYHRYTPYEPHARVVLAWFELFKQHQGNLKRTWEHIEKYGPFIPELGKGSLPPGFAIHSTIRTRSRFTSELLVQMDSLQSILCNATYIGYWAFQQVVVKKHNHEAIVPYDLFMCAFNKLSPVDLNGDPNPEYQPYRSMTRHDKSKRPIEPPTYTGAVFSSDIPVLPMKRMTTQYNQQFPAYYYYLRDNYKQNYLTAACDLVDKTVDGVLMERLKATTLDDDLWQSALESTQKSTHKEVRRLENAIRAAERAQAAIVDNLKIVSLPELIRQMEMSYATHGRDIERWRQELTELQQDNRHRRVLVGARPVLEMVIARWSDVPCVSRRELFDALALRIEVSKVDMLYRRIVVCWRDGTESGVIVAQQRPNISWSPADLQRLQTMVENSADQVDILKAFAGMKWRSIQNRYAYRFGSGRWFAGYQGQRKYGPNVRWQDTEEYRQEQLAQNPTSGVLSSRFPANASLRRPTSHTADRRRAR